MKTQSSYFHKIEDDSMQRSMSGFVFDASVSDLRFDFFIQPPVREKGQPFKSDIATIDQFGNEHWSKGLEFSYT
jgi:hypothetical protein